MAQIQGTEIMEFQAYLSLSTQVKFSSYHWVKNQWDNTMYNLYYTFCDISEMFTS